MAGSGSVRDQRNACVVGRMSAINRPVLLGFKGSASNITRQNRLLACCGIMVEHKQSRRGSRQCSQRITQHAAAAGAKRTRRLLQTELAQGQNGVLGNGKFGGVKRGRVYRSAQVKGNAFCLLAAVVAQVWVAFNSGGAPLRQRILSRPSVATQTMATFYGIADHGNLLRYRRPWQPSAALQTMATFCGIADHGNSLRHRT